MLKIICYYIYLIIYFFYQFVIIRFTNILVLTSTPRVSQLRLPLINHCSQLVSGVNPINIACGCEQRLPLNDISLKIELKRTTYCLSILRLPVINKFSKTEFSISHKHTHIHTFTQPHTNFKLKPIQKCLFLSSSATVTTRRPSTPPGGWLLSPTARW